MYQCGHVLTIGTQNIGDPTVIMFTGQHVLEVGINESNSTKISNSPNSCNSPLYQNFFLAALYYISQLSATAPQYSQDVKEDTMTLGSFLKRNIKNLRNQVTWFWRIYLSEFIQHAVNLTISSVSPIPSSDWNSINQKLKRMSIKDNIIITWLSIVYQNISSIKWPIIQVILSHSTLTDWLLTQVIQEKGGGIRLVPLGEWYSAAILLYHFYCHADNDHNFNEHVPAKIIMVRLEQVNQLISASIL